MGEAVDPEAAAGVLARVQAVHGEHEAAERPERDRDAVAAEEGQPVVDVHAALREEDEAGERRGGDAELHVGVVEVEAAGLAAGRALAAGLGHDVEWGGSCLRLVK